LNYVSPIAYETGDAVKTSARITINTKAVSVEAAMVSKSVDNVKISNCFYDIIIESDGRISHLYDKKADRIVINTAANDFRLYLDGPQYSDAWNVDIEYKKRLVDMKWENQLTVMENLPERTVVELHKKSVDTEISQYIIIYNNMNRIDFETRVNWQEKHKMLRVVFPVLVSSHEVTAEIAYGLVKHTTHPNNPWEKARFELAGHRFIDLSEEGYGVSLLNDSKYGYDTLNNEMAITLLRNTDFPSHYLDIGEHCFTYSLYPHTGTLKEAQVVQAAYLLNSPMITCVGKKSEKDSESLFTIFNHGIILDCMKPAEDGNGIVIRLYEAYGSRGRVELKSSLHILSVCETNPLEEELQSIMVANNAFEFTFAPFEVRTFRVIYQI
jgi:alpha-mannosidase